MKKYSNEEIESLDIFTKYEMSELERIKAQYDKKRKIIETLEEDSDLGKKMRAYLKRSRKLDKQDAVMYDAVKYWFNSKVSTLQLWMYSARPESNWDAIMTKFERDQVLCQYGKSKYAWEPWPRAHFPSGRFKDVDWKAFKKCIIEIEPAAIQSRRYTRKIIALVTIPVLAAILYIGVS